MFSGIYAAVGFAKRQSFVAHQSICFLGCINARIKRDVLGDETQSVERYTK